jgi:hypothetical protein
MQPRPERKRRTQSQAIGRSKGGRTIKILVLTDDLLRFVLLPRHRYDTIGVPPQIEGLRFGALIADTAFDSNCDYRRSRRTGNQGRDRPASTPNAKMPIDAEMYEWRRRIENFFAKLKGSNASPCAPTKQTQASRQSSTSLPPSSTHDESQ